jgi:hypothetical protein
MMIDDADVVTRIQVKAILSCLQEGVDYQAGRVGRIMRTISESLHLVQYHSPVKEPKYKDSTQLKRINLFVSRQAARLVAGTWKGFNKGTVLEHPLPLDIMYRRLQELAMPTLESIGEMLGHYPLITVINEEDKKLKHSGWISPIERYNDAKIEVVRLEEIKFGVEPVWKPAPLSEVSSWRGH